MSYDPAVPVPTIEEIKEVIRKLQGLKRDTESIRGVAENGEDPAKVKEDLQKAEDLIRSLLADAVTKKLDEKKSKDDELWFVGQSDQERQTLEAFDFPDSRLRKLLEMGRSPSKTLQPLLVMKAISPALKNLPSSALKQLRTEFIPKLISADQGQAIPKSTVESKHLKPKTA